MEGEFWSWKGLEGGGGGRVFVMEFYSVELRVVCGLQRQKSPS